MLVDAQLQPSRMAGRLVFLLYALSSALLFSQWCASWWLALLLAFGLSCLLWRVTAWFARGAAQKQPAVSFLEQEPRQAWRWQKQGHSRWYQGRLCRAQGFGAWAVVLCFEISVPRRQRCYCVVWRDQVDAQQWRRLQVLRHLYRG